MITINKCDVAVFFKKRLSKLFFRGLIEEISMTCHGFTTTDAGSLQLLRQLHPQISIVSSEWLTLGADRLIQDIRTYSPKTYIILCCVQETPITEQTPFFSPAASPDTVCYMGELTACLQAWQARSPFRSTHLWAHLNRLPANFLSGWHDMTAAERRVLHLIAEGQSGPEMADSLCISKRTVNNHKTNISRKLTVSGGPGSLVRFVLLNRDKILSLVNE